MHHYNDVKGGWPYTLCKNQDLDCFLQSFLLAHVYEESFLKVISKTDIFYSKVSLLGFGFSSSLAKIFLPPKTSGETIMSQVCTFSNLCHYSEDVLAGPPGPGVPILSSVADHPMNNQYLSLTIRPPPPTLRPPLLCCTLISLIIMYRPFLQS